VTYPVLLSITLLDEVDGLLETVSGKQGTTQGTVTQQIDFKP